MPEIESKKKTVIIDESHVYSLGAMLYNRFVTWRDGKLGKELQWLKNHRAYHSIYDADISRKFEPGEFPQYIGITKMKTSAAYARLIDVYYPATGHKFWTIKHTPFPELNPNDWTREEVMGSSAVDKEEIVKKAAAMMEKKIEDQLIENNADTIIRSVLKDACVYGSGVAKAGTIKVESKARWELNNDGWIKTREEKVIPGLDHVSPFDVYFDPNAKTPKSSIGCYQRHVLNKNEVRQLADFPGFREDVINELIRDYPKGNHERLHHEIERQVTGNVTQVLQSENYEVLEYWGYVDAVELVNAGIEIPESNIDTGYIVNIWLSGHKTIRIQIDNDYEKYTEKYLVLPYEEVSDSIWGIGVPEIMSDSQEVLNAAFRRLLNDIALSGNQIEINVGLLDSRSAHNANEIKSGKIWLRTGGDAANNALKVHRVPSEGGDLISIIDMVRRFIDDETNLPSLVSGQAPNVGTQGAETASGLSMLMGAAQIVIKSVVKNVDDFLVKPLIRCYYNFNMEWTDDDSIKGDMSINALGSSILIAREVQNRNMIEFLGITGNEQDLPLVKRPSLLRNIARNMGFDPDDVIKSDEVVREEASREDPVKQKLNELAIEKAQLENAEIRSRIEVNRSEEEKNRSEVEYKQEFLRQRRVKLADDMRLARQQLAEKKKEERSGGGANARPVKILNQ